MAITREKKQEIISNLEKTFKHSKSVVFVRFKGLTVGSVNELRAKLRQEKVGYRVAKKSLMKKAFEKAGLKDEMPKFEGEVAIAYGEDLLAPAREIWAFQKKFKEAVSILGGIFDGGLKSKDEMLSIASIPPREVLLAQFVNIINSPIQGLAVGLKAIAEKKA